MCTVTFYPISKTEFVLTSNRDESPNRDTLAPDFYQHTEDKIDLIYPKDKLAGGTWIGASERQRMLTLMNGGFVPHKRKDSYRLSRGIIVTKLLETENVKKFLDGFDFQGIEPFTIVLFDYQDKPELLQIVWDEEQLHVESLDLKPRIWSSSPLYTPEMHQLREDWFAEFLEENKLVRPSDLWQFHHEAGNGDREVSLQIERGYVRTKSITQLSLSPMGIEVTYHDLEAGETQANILTF